MVKILSILCATMALIVYVLTLWIGTINNDREQLKKENNSLRTEIERYSQNDLEKDKRKKRVLSWYRLRKAILIGIEIYLIVLLLTSCAKRANPVLRPINCIQDIKTPLDMNNCLIEYDTEYGSLMEK